MYCTLNSNRTSHGIDLVFCHEKAEANGFFVVVEGLVHTKNATAVFVQVNADAIVFNFDDVLLWCFIIVNMD